MMSGVHDRLRRVVLMRRRRLNGEQFQRFLEAAKKVAYFDSSTKLWIPSAKKLVELEEESFSKVINDLVELSALRQEDAEELRSIWLELRRSAVAIASERLEVRGERGLLHLLASSMNDCVISDNGTFRLRSILCLPRLLRVAPANIGVSVLYDEYLTRVVVERRNGRLYWRFGYLDEVAAAALSEIGTLKYYVERALLGPEGEYEGSELVERSIKAVRVLPDERLLITPVGLKHKFANALASWGFSLEERIEELPDLQLPLEKRYELFPHQQEAFSAWFKAKRGSISIFTRGGKSFIALEAIYRLRKPTLILVTTRELMQTWADYIERYLGLPRHRLGFVGGGDKKISEITIATYTSAVRLIDELRGRFELVIFDEAHHVPASTFKNVALRIDSLYRLALSATPKRRDGNELLLYELCGDLVYSLTYRDLVKLKVVAPIERFDALFARNPEEKLELLVELLRKYRDSRVIVFTQYISTAEKVYSRLLKEGFSAEIITGSTSAFRRELAFKRFVEGRVSILVTTTVLDEGVTVPDADVAVIYEGTGEPRQMIQRIGRVLGYYPGKTAKVFELVDISNPREKAAYLRRSWVRELYSLNEAEDERRPRIDSFL